MRAIRSTLSNPSRCLICALLLAGVCAPAWAQSLGDVAKRDAERRKNVKDTGKVLTNKDVPHVPQSDPPPASPSEPPAAEKTDAGAASDKAAAPGPGDAKAADAPKAATDVPKDEKYWRERYKAVQLQLERDQAYLEALQSRVNALTTDFANRDDPAQRAVIGNDRQKAVTEVARLTAAILEDKKAITDFEDEARRAAVPPGWLR